MHYALSSRFNIEKNILQRNISFSEDRSLVRYVLSASNDII